MNKRKKGLCQLLACVMVHCNAGIFITCKCTGSE